MTTKTLPLTAELQDYLIAHGSTPDELVSDLIAETRATWPRSTMQIAPEQARFLTILTMITGVRYAVEIGTFTGLSSIAISRGMAPDGRMVCCDVSEEYTSTARKYWARAGLTERIELRLGPALDTVRAMPAEPHIDLAFIDADKTSYGAYWNELVPRLRPGGVLVVDNTLWSGRVLDPQERDDHAIVAFNDQVVADERVDAVLLPIGDGMTVARRK